MTVAVEVVDGTGLVTHQEIARALVEAVLDAEGVSGEVTVAFIDEAAITELNRRYRKSNVPTDVLAFDYAAEPGWPAEAESGGVAGEVAVCPRVVIRYADEDGRDPAAQLGWTLIHGALHLAGYDHETDHGEMRAREQRLLEQFDGLVRLLSVAGGSR
jgi:probable rRNA maturation factor